MRQKWAQLAYIGLYSGPGRARVAGESYVVETTALSVLRQPDPFTDYVYVDNDPECLDALATRIHASGTSANVTFIPGDVNESVVAVREALPRYSRSRGLLSFCFVDPFDIQLRFETIRGLSGLRMDFLILLMLGVDARRNLQRYLNDESSARIGDLIACAQWRSEYRAERNIIHFILRTFDEAMQGLGYLSAANDLHPVYATGTHVLQYVLAFYTKNEVGLRFWRGSRSSLSPQIDLL